VVVGSDQVNVALSAPGVKGWIIGEVIPHEGGDRVRLG